MLVEGPSSKSADVVAGARDRITLGPPPAWAVLDPVDFNFKGKGGEPLTHIYMSRQVHPDQKRAFFRTATRLETMEAVQHQSQWRLQFEPHTQSVTVHWIKVRRGEREVEQASLDAFRLLQREERLEGFILDGWVTMLLVLGDVRPGDVIEACYTIESLPQLLPELCGSFFTLPPGIPIGKFRFSVRFAQSRPMKWKSSTPELKPAENTSNGETVWDWSTENYSSPAPEPHTPEWHLSSSWIQVSDCPDWTRVAAAVARVWHSGQEDPSLAQLADPIAAQTADPLLRAEQAIDLLQNEFRYLSVALDLGGHVPTAPAIVAGRRFGDCKDLSFLLVQLLRRLDISARAILVNTSLRQSLNELLPMAALFNHVVVEYEIQGQTRWVDVTMKHQGGGALTRSIPDYGVGLPVDQKASALVQPPPASLPHGVYHVKETILLDTTGADSLLSVLLTARGYYADMLRAQFANQGVEKVAKERLHSCAIRFGNARRSGELVYRDNPAANEFVVAEVFAINGFLHADEIPGRCRLVFPNNLVGGALAMPEPGDRRNPFTLPYPCHIGHQIEIQSGVLAPISMQRSRVESEFVKFTRSHKSLSGFLSMTLNLTTTAAAVPPGSVNKHRDIVGEIWQESTWQLRVPIGHSHPSRRRDFGALPSPARKPAASVAIQRPKPVPLPPGVPARAEDTLQIAAAAPMAADAASSLASPGLSQPAASPETKQVKPAVRPRRRRPSPFWKAMRWVFLWLAIFGVIALILYITYQTTHHPRL